MPTYEYRCEACGNEFEEFQSISAPAIKKCPKCKKNSVKRLISAGAGVIFKGSGFYETDYRTDSYKSGEKKDTDAQKPAEKPAENKAADAAKPAESKPATEPKPAAPKSAAKAPKSVK